MMSILQIIEALTESELDHLSNAGSISQALIQLGYSPNNPKARQRLKRRFNEAGVSTQKLPAYKQYTTHDVITAVARCNCMSNVLLALGLTNHGSNYKTIQRVIDREGLDTSHFDLSEARRKHKRTWSFEEIFCENSSYHRPMLAKAVERFGVLEYKCNLCNNSGMWNGFPLPLQVDHINGISNDNRINNLRYLCPNCHSQTYTWGRKAR